MGRLRGIYGIGRVPRGYFGAAVPAHTASIRHLKDLLLRVLAIHHLNPGSLTADGVFGIHLPVCLDPRSHSTACACWTRLSLRRPVLESADYDQRMLPGILLVLTLMGQSVGYALVRRKHEPLLSGLPYHSPNNRAAENYSSTGLSAEKLNCKPDAQAGHTLPKLRSADGRVKQASAQFEEPNFALFHVVTIHNSTLPCTGLRRLCN